MPEFQNDIIDLNELNRKVDANKKRKRKAFRRRGSRLLLLQFLLFAITIVLLVLGDVGAISFPVSVTGAFLATVICSFVAGYHIGIPKA